MTTGTDWQIIDNYYADFYVNPIIRETLIDQSRTVYEISRIQNEKKRSEISQRKKKNLLFKRIANLL